VQQLKEVGVELDFVVEAQMLQELVEEVDWHACCLSPAL
jgi:hypothetical protein